MQIKHTIHAWLEWLGGFLSSEAGAHIDESADDTWFATTAYACGRRHKDVGISCQDYAEAFCRDNLFVIALADGAGSCSHAEHGAKRAVKAIGTLLIDDFDALLDMSPDDRQVCIVSHTLEALQDEAAQLGCDINDLSSTLLAIASDGQQYLSVHVGDGVIAATRSEKLEVVSEPWNGEYANVTCFTTSPNLEESYRVSIAPLEGITGFCLMSDGATESLYRRDTGDLAPAVAKLMRYCAEQPDTAQADLQETIETQLTTKTNDDVSLAILVNPS